MIYWEKTIEYSFVLKFYTKFSSLFAPLDGKHEKLGDLVINNEGGLILIEFKRNRDTIDSEEAKFDGCYDDAKERLKDRDGHHFIVFGEEVDGLLDLKAIRYFGEEDVAVLENVFTAGVGLDCFNEYLKEFLRYKSKSASGASGENYLDYSIVACVGGDGNVNACEGLASYIYSDQDLVYAANLGAPSKKLKMK